MVTVYHKVCEYGQGVAAAGRANPLLIQWGPFVVFAAIILWMYWRIAYIPGGQPIGLLDKGFAKLSGLFVKLVRRAQPWRDDVRTAG